MKKVATLAMLFVMAIQTQATDRFVDALYGSGNGTTMFSTITSALNAATAGDRILCATGLYNEGALTINKSVSIVPQTAGGVMTYGGNITIAGSANMKLYIVGLNMGIYSMSTSTISGGSTTTRAQVNLVDCKMSTLTFSSDFYELNAIRTTVSGVTTMKYGSFVASKTTDLYITDETSANNTTDRIMIVADSIMNEFNVRADNYVFSCYNNLMKVVKVHKWNYLSNQANEFFNNEFVSGTTLFIAWQSVPGYNFKFTGNSFVSGGVSFNTGGSYCSSPSYTYAYYYDAPDCGLTYSSSSSSFPNVGNGGFFEWTYNGIDLPCSTPTASNPIVLTRVVGTVGTNVNSGNPNHEFYDIDLTVGDRGRFGGPYTVNNFFPSSNPTGSKAFIYDLKIPADLFPGQNVDIKAKAYHRN